MARDSLDRLIGVLDYLVDEKVGIIRRLGETPREPGIGEFFFWYAQASDTSAFTRNQNFGNTGGASVVREKAMAKAVGEAVERYCSAIFEVEDYPLFSQEEAPFECLEPDSLALFSPQQYASAGFPWSPFTPSTPVRWAAMYDPLARREVHVPACLIHVPYYYYEDSGDTAITQPISTGLACHLGLAEASRAAIQEVIERDAFTIAWQAALSPPQIIPETLDDQAYDLLERIERAEAEVTLFDLTLDHGVPTVLAVARSQVASTPALALAAATRLSPGEAVKTCLEELVHTRRYSQLIKSKMVHFDPGPDFCQVHEQTGHLRYWADQDKLPLAEFLYASPERVEFEEMDDLSTGHPLSDVAELCLRVRKAGHRVLLRNLTTPDVGQLGLAVVRAVIPGFHPLYMGYQTRALGGRRLWTVPQKLGYQGRSPSQGDNPLPHPYP